MMLLEDDYDRDNDHEGAVREPVPSPPARLDAGRQSQPTKHPAIPPLQNSTFNIHHSTFGRYEAYIACMQPTWTILIFLLAGLTAGFAVAWALGRRRADELAAAARRETGAETATLQERLRLREERLAEAAAAASVREGEFRQATETIARLNAEVADLHARLEAEQRQAGEKLKLLEEAKRQLADQFKVLANEIFDDKSKKFTQASGERLDLLLKPLAERLLDFSKKVEDTHEKGVRERATIKQLIESLTEKNQLLGAEAHNLANALRGQAKTQGNWGEMVLERVLAASGLEKGLAYDVQESHVDQDGRRLQPDVVIHLPDDKSIVIDAKVSLVAYERYTAEDATAEVRERALREHIQSLRNHIKGLGEKNYQNLVGITSPNFIFLFVPIESAYALAMREESTLFDEASQRKIVIVTPSTLLASLSLINYLWQQEKQSRNAADIAALAGKLYDKLADFAKSLAQVGDRLTQAQTSYDEAMKRLATGRGNALGTAEKLRAMGARTAKEIPRDLIDDDDNDDGSAPSLPPGIAPPPER
jgi:DNA recombination protein RmuC